MVGQLVLYVKRLTETAKLPTRGTPEAAGYDLYLDEDVTMNPGEFKMASTGIAVAIPKGYFGLIAPRSGMATKQGIMLRSSNIVDSDYRGEVKLALWHCGIQTAYLIPGDRVAQMVLIPHCVGDVSELETLTVTGRGEGGFGSTGK